MEEEQLEYLYPDMYGNDDHEDLSIIVNEPIDYDVLVAY